MEPSFKSQIVSAIKENQPLEDLHSILLSFKQEGGTQNEAYSQLQDLRPQFSSDLEDKLLEVMDLVVGYCSPHMKVWSQYLNNI